jgi:hypothetical protein
MGKALAILARRTAQCQLQQIVPSTVGQATQAAMNEPADIIESTEGQTTAKSKMSSGLIYAVNKVFKKEASVQNEALKKEASFLNPEQPNVKTNRRQAFVPQTLKDMADQLEIRPEGVCMLMALAKQTGHWLQDVWTAKKDTLLNAGVKAGRAVRYIEFLLKCGEDFSYVARTKITALKAQALATNQNSQSSAAAQPPVAATAQVNAQANHAEDADADAEEPLKAIAKAARYKRFKHVSKSIQVRIYEGSAEVTDGIQSALRGGWSQMKQIYMDIALGNLVEVPQ